MRRRSVDGLSAWGCDDGDMWSRFAFDGWQGQYRRTRRWFDRLVSVSTGLGRLPMDEQIDFALVFFQNAYHVRDYLQQEGAASKAQLDQLMSSTLVLRVCRDLANGAKHRKINNASVDSEPWILREYRPPEWVLVVKAGEKFDLLSLANDCLRAWDDFLAGHNLDPESLSVPQTRLGEALLAARGGDAE